MRRFTRWLRREWRDRGRCSAVFENGMQCVLKFGHDGRCRRP